MFLEFPVDADAAARGERADRVVPVLFRAPAGRRRSPAPVRDVLARFLFAVGLDLDGRVLLVLGRDDADDGPLARFVLLVLLVLFTRAKVGGEPGQAEEHGDR